MRNMGHLRWAPTPQAVPPGGGNAAALLAIPGGPSGSHPRSVAVTTAASQQHSPVALPLVVALSLVTVPPCVPLPDRAPTGRLLPLQRLQCSHALIQLGD